MNKNYMISIVVSSFNGEKYIRGCISSIQKTLNCNYELIFVNDASTDGTKKLLEEYSKLKQIKIIHNRINKGLAISNNIGAKYAKSAYLLFINVDCRIDKYCLYHIVKKFEEDKSIGAIQAKIVREKDKKIDSVGHFISIFGYPYEIGAGENPDIYTKEFEVLGAKTAGLAIRRSLFFKLKGFDHNYHNYGDDTDLSWRVWHAGYKIIFLPNSVVFHEQKSSLIKKTESKFFFEGTKNAFSNILKNASVTTLSFMIPLFIASTFALSLKLILQKRITNATAVLHGIIWNLIHIQKTLEKRRSIRKEGQFNLDSFIYGKYNHFKILTKGLRWLINV